MPAVFRATESPAYSCGNACGRRFPASVRRSLEAEAERLRGDIECVVCGEWQAHYELHHIRPWSVKGRSTEDNGILLCPTCHDLADQAVFMPFDFDEIKGGRLLHVDPITGESEICALFGAAPDVEGSETGTCDKIAHASWNSLNDLRRCNPRRPSLRNEWRRAIAKTQLKLAGALTSWFPADAIRPVQSRRYIITMLARNAVRMGRRLDDRFLLLQGLHSLATNAKAHRHFSEAMKYCNEIRGLLPTVAAQRAAYAAYTARNISVIYEDEGLPGVADDLLGLSDRLSEGNAETLVRRGQVLTVRGDLRKAGQVLEQRLTCQTPTNRPLQRIVAMRVYGVHCCVRGNISEGMEQLDQAGSLAAANHFGHQKQKIEMLMRRLSALHTNGTIRSVRTRKGPSGLPPPLRRLSG